MKKYILFFSIIFGICLTSCTLTRQESCCYDSEILKKSILIPDKISIIINHTEDEELEKELFQMMSVKLNKLNSTKNQELEKLNLNISISERTSVENFENVYSDFIYCYITDSFNCTVYENYIQTSSKRSIITNNRLNENIFPLINELKNISYGN